MRLALAIALVLGASARAEEAQPEVPAPAAPVPTTTPVPPPPPQETGLLARWLTFVKGEAVRIVADNPYGATFQLPKGYAKFSYKWASLRGNSRYDGNGKLGAVVPPLSFQLGGKPELNVEFDVSGWGGSHTFEFGYGITDRISWYGALPYNYMNVTADIRVGEVDDQGNHIGATAASLLGVTDRKKYGTANFLYETLPQLGRPPLGTSFKGAWLLGDIETGVAWNYYRTARMSSAITGRLYLPTAHVPPSERNLMFATGTEIQVGVGSWGLGATQGYDVRLLKSQWVEIVAGSELTAAYRFPQRRAYPTNFVKPVPAAAGLSPTAFPDLSNLEGYFSFAPGWSLGLTARLDVSIALFGISAGYGFGYGQKPRLTGDPLFVGMVDSLGLLGETESHTVSVGAGLSLIPFAIPARISFTWQRVVGGRNVLLYQNHFTLGVEGYIPTQFIFQR